jgi:hypothetical protein
MSTGSKFKRVGVALALCLAVLCAGDLFPASAAQSPQRRLTKSKAKKQELPPLPSGPTGPVQAMPLDTIAAVPPQVSFENNQLTIVAPNSTLGDILRAIRKSTGADIDVPTAPERVVTHLGPGPAREIVADLLNGSRFNYVLLGAPGDDTALTRVVLVAKTANEGVIPNQPAPLSQPGMAQVTSPPQQPQEAPPDLNDQPTADENNAADDNADQQPPPESAEQAPDQAPNPDQPQVKTPQQMLQEMQQRQMQLQQGRPEPVPPGSGTQPHPPEER